MLTEKSYAIYQNNEQTSFKKKGVEPVDPVWMNIYQSNTFRKDFSWLHLLMSQGFKKGKKWRADSPAYSFL